MKIRIELRRVIEGLSSVYKAKVSHSRMLSPSSKCMLLKHFPFSQKQACFSPSATQGTNRCFMRAVPLIPETFRKRKKSMS